VCKFARLGRRTSVIIAVVWGDQKDVQLPGTRTILCIDEDDGMLSCKKGWLREN
jgi:hypothetical protein